MKLDTAYKIFQKLDKEDQLFTYQGEFSDQITTMIISLVAESLNNRDGVMRIKNKVSFIMVESFQNIIRHAEPTVATRIAHSESFQVRSINNGFFITSSNLIKNELIPGLKQTLDELNTLDKKALKLRYMEALDKNGLSEKGGAGLGLIEMARKSGQELMYEFIPASKEKSHFYLQSYLSSTPNSKRDDHSLGNSIDLHNQLSQDGVFVMNKGNFSHEAIKPMLNMVENNLVSHISLKMSQKILFHLLVELLQNISNHSFKSNKGTNEGIFFMGQNEQGYFITAGNYIDKRKIDDLKRTIDHLNSLSDNDLKHMYMKKLRDGNNEKSNGAGIGLIDLARFSKERLQYKLFDVDKEKSFFSIMVID